MDVGPTNLKIPVGAPGSPTSQKNKEMLENKGNRTQKRGKDIAVGLRQINHVARESPR